MSKSIPNAGTYRAKLNGPAVVYKADSGSLCVALAVTLTSSSEVAWSGKTQMVLFKSNGEPSTRNINTIKAIFGWDGADPFWLEDNDLSAAEFDIQGDHETYVPEGQSDERTVFKIQWVNAPGDTGFSMPEKADRKSILSEFGAKFRALAGVGSKKPAGKAVPAPAPAAKAPAPAGGPPGKKAAAPPAAKGKTAGGQPLTSTMEETWAAMEAKFPDLSEDDKGDRWYTELDKLFPGKTNDDLSIQQWGQFKAHLEGLE